MSPPTRVRWILEKSLLTPVEEHSGQATIVPPLMDTSSSNSCEHDAHWYS
jgi:hypothetical protein